MVLAWYFITIVTISSYVATGVFVNYTKLFGTSIRGALNFSELVDYDGYSSETHTVTTGDGYILTLYRIPLQKTCNASAGVIVFMHAMYLSGDDCIVPGPGRSHCYIYADSCYDVWVLNVRGNRYSRKHLHYNPDTDSRFWNFSVDEMALFDLPASLDYILKVTGIKQVTYVGHAQGTTMLLLLCALKPEYNAKINVGFGLSTTAWLDHSTFPVVEAGGILSPLFTAVANLGVNSEILPYGGLTQTAAKLLCGSTTLSFPLCSAAVFGLLGYNRFQITAEVLSVVVGHAPAGTSFKDFVRWSQIKKNGFTEYDFGEVGNMMKYGSINPPEYNLNAINMTWIFIASLNDNVGDVQDLYILTRRLVNSNYKVCVLSDITFGHLDFVYGRDIPLYITPTVLKYLQNGNVECC